MSTAKASGWKLLPNSPSASSRTDDIWFFNDTVGWLVNSSGYVAKTTDGGKFWENKYFVFPGGPSLPYLRCMSWAKDEQHGWIGAVTGIDPTLNFPIKGFPNGQTEKEFQEQLAEAHYTDQLIVKTTDGGESWEKVTNLPKDSPPGICGFHAVNSKVAYGSGTNDPGLKPGPSIVKTTDGGDSWELIPMEKYADNLIDIYFFDENHGFVVGGKNSDSCPKTNEAYYPVPRLSRYVQLRPVVLETTDGGKTWVNRAENTEGLACGEWGWKIQFLPGGKHGFIALENFRDAAILKTDDGGQTWVRKHVALNQEADSPGINVDIEGIGFINENQGWVGGWGDNFKGFQNSYTADGGETWSRQDYLCNNPGGGDPRYRINRYRFVDNTGFCCGQQIFKLGKVSSYANKTAVGKTKAAFGKSTITAADLNDASGGRVAPHANFIAPVTGNAIEAGKEFDISHKSLDDGSVEISYTLPEGVQKVFVGLWNQFAFHIRTLVDGVAEKAGRQTIIWDGKDDFGNPAGKGLFICRMATDAENGGSHMLRVDLPAGG